VQRFLFGEGSLSPFGAPAPATAPSLKSVESEGVADTSTTPPPPTASRSSGALHAAGAGRRFSNVSNLALDLGSTATSAPRLHQVKTSSTFTRFRFPVTLERNTWAVDSEASYWSRSRFKRVLS